MNVRFLLFLVVILVVVGCRKEEPVDLSNTCSVANPLEDLLWLKEKVEEMDKGEQTKGFEQWVTLAEYKGESVFIVNTYCEMCFVRTPVYNCKGEKVCEVGEENSECPDFREIVRNQRVIWKSRGSIQ